MGDVVHPPSSMTPYAVACKACRPLVKSKEKKALDFSFVLVRIAVLCSCLVQDPELLRGSAMIQLAYRCHGLCKTRRNTILGRLRRNMRVPSFAHQDAMGEGKVEKCPTGMSQGFALRSCMARARLIARSCQCQHICVKPLPSSALMERSMWRHHSSHARRTRRDCVKLNASA